MSPKAEKIAYKTVITDSGSSNLSLLRLLQTSDLSRLVFPARGTKISKGFTACTYMKKKKKRDQSGSYRFISSHINRGAQDSVLYASCLRILPIILPCFHLLPTPSCLGGSCSASSKLLMFEKQPHLAKQKNMSTSCLQVIEKGPTKQSAVGRKANPVGSLNSYGTCLQQGRTGVKTLRSKERLEKQNLLKATA